jgi:hypothetical protein
VSEFGTFWVNRKNRKRHADGKCRGLTQTRVYLDLFYGPDSGWVPQDAEPRPTYRRRIKKVEPADADELAALEAFTFPCKLCVPGARALSEHLVVDFE